MTKKYSQEELDQILLSKKINEFYLAIIENRQELLTLLELLSNSSDFLLVISNRSLFLDNSFCISI